LKLPSAFINNIRSRSLIALLAISIISLSVITILVIGSLSIIRESYRIKEESENLRISFIENQKKRVKYEVEKAVEFIEYNRSLSQEKIKQNLKARIDEAWEIANNIYQENKSVKNSQEIKKMICDALRPIRFNSGRGDIFIYSLDGVSVMLPRSRYAENRPSLNFQDSLGNFMVRNEINMLKEVDHGFLTYRAPKSKHSPDSLIYKYTYIKKFSPFNWYFGSKDYLKDYELELKEEMLNWISHIRYGDEGYIYINSTDGKALLTNGVKADQPIDIFSSGDTNWVNVYKKQLGIVKSIGSGYNEYKFYKLASKDFEPKVSYMKLVNDWDWLIGAGFYKNDIEKEIVQKQAQLTAKINNWIIRLVLLISFFLILAFIFAKIFSNKLRKEFGKFNQSFRKASMESILMDKNQVSFAEFRELAESVNNTIQERDIARKAFDKEQALLRSLIDSIPDFIFFKDLNSKYVGCNKAFANYLGIDEKEIIGRSDYDFFSKEVADSYNESDIQILEDKTPIRNEEWNIFPDGSRHLLDTVKVLYYDKKGKALGIMALSRDITEKQETQEQFRAAKEKAEESDRLKTAFLANMSHEIRTPMNSIIGFSSLLTEENLSENDRSEYIQHINQAGESLLNLIDDIIDIAKIEAGQLTVSIESYSLNELFIELHTTHAELIRRKFNSEVVLKVIPSDLPYGNTIMTDPFRLKQVISNLLGNAMKFTTQGVISYGFRIENENILFFVKDTGIGISEDNQKIIFSRFRQAQNNRKRHFGGTGLGLAISQHIVGLLGGNIWVESTPGEGSTFYFTLPYNPVETQLKQVESKNQDRTLVYDWSNKSMLVIEEVDSSFNYITAALSRTGIKLIRATDETSGVQECFSNDSIDLIYLDVNASHLNGYNAARKMKELWPDKKIIAQTSDDFHDDYMAQHGDCCDDFIIKPVRFNLLMKVLAKYLE